MEDLIIKINRKTRQVDLNNVSYIGNDHENLQENMIFQFEDEFVDGQARLEYEINGTKNYIILEKVEKTYQIPVKNVITIYQEKTLGKIQFQLVITEGTDEEETPVFKSNIFYLRCRPSINAVSEAPEGYELWIEQANAKLSQMDNLDIDVEKVDDVATVTITKKDGTTKSVEIYDGQGGGGGTGDHAELENLDFDNSGHTGFQRAGNYIEEETDPTVPSHVKGIQQADINNWNSKADMEDIPDVSQFITNAANNLINYYLKTETYTKQEVNNLIGQIQTVHIEVVQTLPTTGQSNIIYLVSKTGSTGDVYNEYIYVNNAWELIGSTEVDLTGYAKETWVNQQIANFLTRAEIEALIPTQLANLTEDSTHRVVTDTEKATWNGKQDELVSGTNIKTVGGQSILGAGDLQVSGDCHVLGTFGDFTTSNRLNLNDLDVGTYLIMNKKSADTTDAICFVGTYKGTTSNLDKNRVDTIISYASTLYMLKKITDDLSSNTVVAQLIVNIISDSQLIAQQYYIRTKSTGLELISGNNFQITSFIPLSADTTVWGKKTFTVLPESSVTPTTDKQLVNKKYVDDTVGDINTALENIINGGVE